MDLYQVLGVGKDATPDEIKKAYRSLAMKHHPDRSGDPAAFRAVQQAYEVLSDPERRSRYDATGQTREGPDYKAEAASTFAKILIQIVDADDIDPDHINIIKVMLDHIDKLKRDIQGKQKQADRVMRKREKALARLKSKSPDNRLAQHALEDSVKGMQREREKLKYHAQCVSEMRRLAEGYTYETVQPQTMDEVFAKAAANRPGSPFFRFGG